jgi:hypothetical protein
VFEKQSGIKVRHSNRICKQISIARAGGPAPAGGSAPDHVLIPIGAINISIAERDVLINQEKDAFL